MARASDAVGLGKLAVDAVRGLTDVVESMHGTIASATLPIGVPPKSATRGLTRLVYQTIRGVTGIVGRGVDLVHASPSEQSSPRRDVLVSALNGVIGDHLAATDNPLAMPMRLHGSAAGGRALVLVHGLCMHHVRWKRDGHDHGDVLARTHGLAPIYASYNSGRHISSNGRDLADALEALDADELVLLGHSMGGLVLRSACEYGRRADHRWLAKLSHLVFLGTPHHGAPLERAGNLAQVLLGLSPYVAPIIRIGGGRSAGIRDLRFGNVLDEDWADRDPHDRRDPRTPVALPAGVACFAIAGSRGGKGDGLVPVASALGHHDDPRFELAIPQQRVVEDCDHLGLLAHPAVAEQLAAWL
ncbi:MAG TPA: hypothetical protein VGG28_14475 [Kofleriaceae bacterium]|jgi:pimeloyl-ACP methyl ester carboxylesterase